MLAMMQATPALVQSADRDRYSNGDLSAQMDKLGLQNGTSSPFTFIPPEPKETYRELLGKCLDWDLEILRTMADDEDVSLSVLSQEHVALLSECATRWRLPPSFRAWQFLDGIVDRCEQGLVPSACVHEATAMLQKVLEEMPLSTWAIPDVSFPLAKI